MPNIARRQILANLEASLAASPAFDAETVFKEALGQAGLKDKPFFTPEETATVARAMMEGAQARMREAAPLLENPEAPEAEA